ncbi:MAG: PPC domain-containing protein [Proteobacteria bacterium]|nr:PPC domain-containing protein [Pseudomonadota bacterium]
MATDRDGDVLSFDFFTDIPNVRKRASMTRTPSGTGLFRWTPLAADVGVWPIDFIVDDGARREIVTIQIEVRSAVGEQSAPVFRKPLGTGSTLDFATRQCIEIDIQIEDQDSTSVILTQEEPLIAGATLSSTGGLTGTWTWCPSKEQRAGDEARFRLVLSADDLTNSKTVKNYLVVLRRDSKPGCPGAAPAVSHVPQDQSTLVGLTMSAEISDDVGLKHDPLLYYSLEPVASPPDLTRMTQVCMQLAGGDTTQGTYTAEVPNPVASGQAGDTATVYYVIVANDNDDLDSDCDHETQAPASGVFEMTVTNPGGSGGAAICEACTDDVQCGDTDDLDDLCVRVGVAADTFCLQGCTADTDCPTHFVCSSDPIESVSGVSARQCVPNSNDCSDPSGTICRDDSLENNDNMTQAEANPALAAGTYELVSCPAQSGDDEDWYTIELTGQAQVTATLEGGTGSDLDLWLYNAAGVKLDKSVSLTSSESVGGCLDAGTYYIRVNAIGQAENAYTLTYTEEVGGCTPTCTDDSSEDDDSRSQARYADIVPDPFVSQGNAICAGDDDWYKVYLYSGETLTVDLTHTHVDGDLDLHFYNSAGTDLTPCSEADPSTCSVSHGQSTTDNEHFVYTVPAGCVLFPCTFYVVVHGWRGAENNYDLRIEL